MIIYIFQVLLHADNNIQLTTNEKEFIQKHPVINLVTSYNFEPFTILNPDGTASGYDRDLLNIVEQKTGLKFNITFGNWDEMRTKTLKGQFDGFGSGGYHKERKKKLNHSKAYLTFSTFVITKKGNPLNLYSLKDLENKKVAIQKGNKLFIQIINDLNLDIEILWVDSVFDMLNAVASNRADFTVLDETVHYLAKINGLQNAIDTSFSVGEPFKLYFWFRKDYSELVSIFNKVFNSLNAEQKIQLRDKWFKTKEKFDYTLFFKFFGVMFIVVLFLAYRHYILKKHADDLEKQKDILEHQAHYDTLTGLPNLLLSIDRVNQAIKNAERNKKYAAILFVDLDHFKEINDIYGHKAGDETLKVSSQRLLETVREKDTVARIGGDEFLIILDSLSEKNYAGLVAKKILETLEKAIIIEGKENYISCSIGISIYPDNGKSNRELVRSADLAMYEIKKSGKNNFKYYKT